MAPVVTLGIREAQAECIDSNVISFHLFSQLLSNSYYTLPVRICGNEITKLVAHTGFEPVISSLRGRCPKPLDECATASYDNKILKKFTTSEAKSSQVIFTVELFGKFLQSCPCGMSNKSLEAYHYTLEGFIGYPITAEGISRYLNSLSCGNGELKFYSCLRALCNWLYNNDNIADNSIKKVSIPRTSKKLLPAITQEQLQILLDHCHFEQDKALISFLWWSGCRISEAINTRASDFNWNEGTVVTLGKGSKYRRALAGNGIVRQWFDKLTMDGK